MLLCSCAFCLACYCLIHGWGISKQLMELQALYFEVLYIIHRIGMPVGPSQAWISHDCNGAAVCVAARIWRVAEGCKP